MKRILIFAVLAAIIIVPFAGVVAQEPGEGGIVVEASTRTSANLTSFLPIRCSGVDCSNPSALMFPTLIALSHETQNFEIGYPGSIATDMQVSEDGTTYTFTLRDDMAWTDGEPLTVDDIAFTLEAFKVGEGMGMSSSYAPYARDIASYEIVDENTIAITMNEANCQALSRLSVPATPAHAYGYEGDPEAFDWASMIDNDFDLNPTATAGPFKFERLEPGTQIVLSGNETYVDPTNGVGVMPEGYIFLDILDENVMQERFVAGGADNPNYVREPNAFNVILDSAAENDAIQVLSEAGRVWHYLAMNTADPNNPQNGLDEDGNPVDQGQHPIFGDVKVRQALQYAMNIEDIVNGPLDGNATPMIAGTIPSAFTIHPDLERRPFDLDQARALLDEAGWTSTGDPLVDGGDGLRTCTSCATAEEGTELAFELLNVGDVRGDVAVVLQDQFAKVGVEVFVEVVDFNTMYDDLMGGQIFDAAVAGWRGSLPFDPDQRSFFGAEVDIYGEGYGFNFGSYYNEEFETLGSQVNNSAATNNCDVASIQEIAYRMQEILWEEQPYLWLYALNSVYAAQGVENFDPYPNFGNWNADAWIVSQ